MTSKVQDYDEAAGNNTLRGSTSIDEGMAPSDVNNAMRELMSHLRKWNLYRDHISGLAIANDSDAAHDINFPIGECADSTNVQMLHVDSALVKQIDANWAAGTGAGGFPSGLTLTANTWYHLFVIGVPATGVVDAGFDTSTSATNLIADAPTYTLFRRVGSVLTDSSSNILGFTSTEMGGGGLLVEWDDPSLDFDSTTVTTSATNATLSTPPDYKVVAHLNYFSTNASSAQVYVRSPAADDEAPSNSAAPLGNVDAQNPSNAFGMGQLRVMTNTSKQVTVRSTVASTTVRLATMGWEDFRR